MQDSVNIATLNFSGCVIAVSQLQVNSVPNTATQIDTRNTTTTLSVSRPQTIFLFPDGTA